MKIHLAKSNGAKPACGRVGDRHGAVSQTYDRWLKESADNRCEKCCGTILGKKVLARLDR